MPRARRRRSRSVARRRRGRTVFLVVLAALAAGVLVGSLVEIHAQSVAYRISTDTGYGQLARPVVEASNRTGSQLAGLMSKAAQLPNRLAPETARALIQQGLDEAVGSADQQATQAAALVPPYPSGGVSDRFTQVMSERARATSDLRTAIDRRLGMVPLPIAGAPPTASPPSSSALISIGQTTAAMTAVGVIFVHADSLYRSLLSSVRAQRIPIRLPVSVWAPPPIAEAPLGPGQLGAAASSLSGSVPLVPFHQLVVTAVGLSPPAVTTGAPGTLGDSCSAPVSTVATSTPTVLPPTNSVTMAATVTNCGTVVEAGVTVTQTLSVADPPGTPPPPPGSRGSRVESQVTLRSGSSVALSLPPLTVAGGHLYHLDLTVAIPPSQAAANPAGSSQQFLLQITS